MNESEKFFYNNIRYCFGNFTDANVREVMSEEERCNRAAKLARAEEWGAKKEIAFAWGIEDEIYSEDSLDAPVWCTWICIIDWGRGKTKTIGGIEFENNQSPFINEPYPKLRAAARVIQADLLVEFMEKEEKVRSKAVM